MVKNLSNPINARKVTKLLQEDIEAQGYTIDARKVSVFFSDNRIQDLITALRQLKQSGLIPEDYTLSSNMRELLVEEEFMDIHQKMNDRNRERKRGYEILDSFNSIEFQSQLESLKKKLLKSWSGGISVEGGEFENFDRKFARPMKYFTEHMASNGITVSELQAFTVVYATDYLSLGDNSKEDIYYLVFNRFDLLKSELANEFGFTYSWPEVSGTSFIEIGKKLTVVAELAEFAKQFRSISGLDTYSDEVILGFFLELLDDQLLEEMVKKNIIYRWSQDAIADDPRRWLIPPAEFQLDYRTRNFLEQVTLTHTLLTKMLPDPPEFIELLEATYEMDSKSRAIYLAKMLESSLTRKAVALQFGTTLANFFENFKTNPAKVSPFLDTTLKYYNKSNLQTVMSTLEHNIKTGVKNTTGIIKKYIKEMPDEELNDIISNIMDESLQSAYQALSVSDQGSSDLLPAEEGSPQAEIPETPSVTIKQIEKTLHEMDEESMKSFFKSLLDNAFTLTHKFSRDLEPQREEPVSTEGGLKELVQDFLSTANYHGRKNTQAKEYKQQIEEEHDLPPDLAEQIAFISSYVTYQIASKSGPSGSSMHKSLVTYYTKKSVNLRNFVLANGQRLADIPKLDTFLRKDLQQAHVIVSLASKLRTDTYNAWTPLPTIASKNAHFLNEFILPNMFFWQRLPKELIMTLLDNELIDNSKARELLSLTARDSLHEAYALLVMGASNRVNTFEEADLFLEDCFGSTADNFTLNPRQGEAEIAQETVFLWNKLMEEN